MLVGFSLREGIWAQGGEDDSCQSYVACVPPFPSLNHLQGPVCMSCRLSAIRPGECLAKRSSVSPTCGRDSSNPPYVPGVQGLS